MRFIPIWLHIAADYLSGVLLLAAPAMFAWRLTTPAGAFSIAAGIIIIMLSIFTRYPGGLIRIIPFSAHLIADIMLVIPFMIAAMMIPGTPRALFSVMTALSLLFGACTRKATHQTIGWYSHYAMGICWAFVYRQLYKRMTAGITTGIFLGILSGIAGDIIWSVLFKIQTRPPKTDLHNLRRQLLIAHIIYGLIITRLFSCSKHRLPIAWPTQNLSAYKF